MMTKDIFHPIILQPNSLVLLVGPSGSGKSTFAHNYFRPTEIVSSDVCRALVCDDESNQRVSGTAFEVFYKIIDSRLKHKKLTVADATNLTRSARYSLSRYASEHEVPLVVLAFDTPVEQCIANNAKRARFVPPEVITKHHADYLGALERIMDGGDYEPVYDQVIRLDPEQRYTVKIATPGVTEMLAVGWDIIGDIHGCMEELCELLARLGYEIEVHTTFPLRAIHPYGRRIAFVGDITDRGPFNDAALAAVKSLVDAGDAVCVQGNHDNKLGRALKGNKVKIGHGLQGTLDQLNEFAPPEAQAEYKDFLINLPYQLTLTVPGQSIPESVVISHAGIPRYMVGRNDKTAQSHAIYGDVKGHGDDGFPIRSEAWVSSWPNQRGQPWQVHGHTVTDNAFGDRDYRVVNVDSGCVFGGKLTAFRFPEVTLVQVDALKTYHEREKSINED
jgi:predicted kinase